MLLKIFSNTKLFSWRNKPLRVAAILLGILLAVFVYMAVVGISVDTSGLRERLGSMMTQSLGREVRFDGALQLEISARPKLKVAGMHIANAQGFEGGDFASLGEANLALDLWPLLRLRFQIEELSGRDVRLRLQLNKSGKNNWTFSTPKNKDAIPVSSVEDAGGVELENILARLDIKRVSLEDLNVEFIGVNSKHHFFELQSLVAQLPAGEPVKLALHGKVEKTHPYKLQFTGGTIADMARFDEPWPIDLKLDFMSTQLLLSGTVSDSAGIVSFVLSTQNLGEFEQLLQTKLPAVRAANISGLVKYSTGKISLENLSGHMGKTSLQGDLSFDYAGLRPKVMGALSLPVLDLRPFISDTADDDAESPKGLAEVYREISKATFSLKALNEMDANLTLRIGQWLSLPGNVHDAMLQIKLERGKLLMPMQLNMADVRLQGSASADASVSPAKFSFSLGMRDSNLGNLGGVLLGVPNVKGRLGLFNWRVSARGDSGAALMESLDVQIKVSAAKLSYGNGPGERPVNFALDNFELALPAGKNLHGELHGMLLDKSFNATLRGGSLSALTRDDPEPIDFDMQAGTARATIHAVLQAAEQKSTSEISFDVSAPHSREVASWFGLNPGADAPIKLSGKFHADSERWHLEDFSLLLGRSDLSADVMHTQEQGRALTRLQLKGELVDVEQLQSLSPAAKEKSRASTGVAVNMMDIPILPGGINLADADISVHLKRMTSASSLVVRDVRFNGKIREGMMPVSPFSANVADNDFIGAILLDLRTQQPHSVIWISAEKVEVGSVLKKLGIASNIDSSVDYVSVQLDLHSSHLGQLLANSELLAVVDGGHIAVMDANTGGKMNIVLDHGELKSAAGAPVFLDLLGAVNNAPVSIHIKTAAAADLINPQLTIPFKFNASTSGANINLSGGLDRSVSKKSLALSLEMSGSRFDNLNALLATSLPPWGPWAATGKFVMGESGYEVSGLKLQVGGSQLAGQGKLDTRVVPPRLDVVLSAPTIQLDDFKFGDWSPEKSKSVVTEKSDGETGLSAKANKASAQTQQLLSPAVLARQNAYLSVKVDQVVSGQDVLGNGKLDAQLENGRVAVGPVVVNTPGGSASFLLKYEPSKSDVLINLQANVKQLDYGILARRLDHKSEMSGLLSLDADVSSRTQYLSDIFKHGKGHVDFSLWPENLKSGLLDVWAVNVLMALLPAIDPSNESKVNCAIGKFVLADGRLSDKSILIDTSRMRVTGKGAVDFDSGKINFYVKPRAKTPQFLSLAIPIEVSGTLDDFSVGVRTKDVVQTVGQFVTSVVWVPLKMAFGSEMPVDGRDVCARASP